MEKQLQPSEGEGSNLTHSPKTLKTLGLLQHFQELPFIKQSLKDIFKNPQSDAMAELGHVPP